jgi:hypothetical protein
MMLVLTALVGEWVPTGPIAAQWDSPSAES